MKIHPVSCCTNVFGRGRIIVMIVAALPLRGDGVRQMVRFELPIRRTT